MLSRTSIALLYVSAKPNSHAIFGGLRDCVRVPCGARFAIGPAIRQQHGELLLVPRRRNVGGLGIFLRDNGYEPLWHRPDIKFLLGRIHSPSSSISSTANTPSALRALSSF